MLPAYADCPRRAAARQFRKMIERAGFALRQTLPSIGASVGTATHAVIDDFFKAKLAGSEFDEAKAVDAAMAGLQEEVAPGCVWDDSTPSVEVARQQVRRMAAAYIHGGGTQKIVPLAVELQLEADISDGWQLTGRVDLVAAHPDGGAWLRDYKTGGVVRPHFSQLGGYSLLYRSNPPDGLPNEVSAATIDFIHRTPKTRSQKEPASTEYHVGLCESEAWDVVHRIKQEVSEFQRTGKPNVFPSNFNSMLCTPVYCPAHGTTWCPLSSTLNR